MTLFEALTGGAFDRLSWQHSGEFDQNFSKKSNAPGFARGGGMGGFGIDRYISVISVKPVETLIMRKQIEPKRPYFGSTPLAWLQEESDYRKASGEEGNKKVKIERI